MPLKLFSAVFAGRFSAGLPASPPAVCRGSDKDLAYRPDATGAAGGGLQRGPMRATLPSHRPGKSWLGQTVRHPIPFLVR